MAEEPRNEAINREREWVLRKIDDIEATQPRRYVIHANGRMTVEVLWSPEAKRAVDSAVELLKIIGEQEG